MNLDNSWSIILKDNENNDFIQYIEADDFDDAVDKAKNTFEARLYKIGSRYTTVQGQKACKHTKLRDRLRFGFNAGWTTVDVEGLTIYEAIAKAKKHKFVQGKEITEIYTIKD
jgi:hypothetical protein